MSGLWTWDPESDAVTWSASVAALYGVPEAATTYREHFWVTVENRGEWRATKYDAMY